MDRTELISSSVSLRDLADLVPDAPTPLPPAPAALDDSPNDLTALKPLGSYVSAPASTLSALRVMAQEEAARQAGPDSAAAAAAAAATPQAQPAGLMSPFSDASKSAPPQRTLSAPHSELAWLHQRPAPRSVSHKGPYAGDLATAAAARPSRPSFPAPPPSSNTASPSRRRDPSPAKPPAVPARRPRAEDMVAAADSDDDVLPEARDLHGKGLWEADSDLDVDVVLAQRPKPRFWRRRKFWKVAIPALVMLAMILAGVCLLVFAPTSLTTSFQSWRLCFFIAGLPVIWWIGDGVSRCIVWAVERSMFTVKNALYFAYAVRKPLSNVIRALLALGWWALIMTVESQAQSSAVNTAYNIVLKLWACVTLFMTANLLKTLLAKMMALKFNQESHLTKMYDSLKKVGMGREFGFRWCM